MTSPAPWPESLLSEGLRRRMCVLLGHDQDDRLPACPITDEQAVTQLVEALELTLDRLDDRHYRPRETL